ncbi:aspartic-type endopeptidase protein [Rutstroemia sp. NJR-2017a WRK4]|nr:aspartic-type endopeptidase protein [Rutstroemia sp. NJR-2017a WRK4]
MDSVMFRRSRSLLLIAGIFVPLATGESSAQVIRWSDKTYGPDGPWQAISVNLGTPSQSIDLLPGGVWTANILGKSVCDDEDDCLASNAGLFDTSASTSYKQVNDSGVISDTTFARQAGALPMLDGSAHTGLDRLSIPIDGSDSETIDNLELLVIESAHQSLANGSKYIPEVGTLALGSPDSNQSLSNTNLTGQYLSSALYSQGKIPSNSFSLHIGSAALKIPGSLVFGGYDESRALEPIITQPSSNGTFPLSLVDLSIVVSEGYSPFSFNGTKSGLLFNKDTAAASDEVLPVNIDPSVPYIYLPSSTCDILASYLPIIYEPSLRLYLWNTTSPLYKPITTSPSFLSFNLSTSTGDSANIQVPFSLLTLNLTGPLSNTSEPTPYFPCQPSTLPSFSTPVWTLGRAFLQAAFFGVNWSANSSSSDKTSSDSNINTQAPFFLAQAPGPSIPTQKIISFTPSTSSLSAPDNPPTFYSTWSSHLLPLTSPISPSLFSTTSSSESQSHKSTTPLSKTALILISVGAFILLVIILLACIWTWKRRINMQNQAIREEIEQEEMLEMEIENRDEEGGTKGRGAGILFQADHLVQLAITIPSEMHLVETGFRDSLKKTGG